jgi:hypothetical protein
MEKIIETTSGYDRSKNPEVKRYRSITLNEAKNLSGHAKILDRHGKVRDIKINGKVKRWKREPDRIEIPCKYGLYEYFTLTNRDYTDIVVEIHEVERFGATWIEDVK